MAGKKNLIVLEKLRRDPAGELKAMLADLEGHTSNRNCDGVKPARWGRRFVASGKDKAPRIRPSYER